MASESTVNKLEHTISSQEKIITSQINQISTLNSQLEELSEENSKFKETIIELKQLYENVSRNYENSSNDLKQMDIVQQLLLQKLAKLSEQYLAIEQLQKQKNYENIQLMQENQKLIGDIKITKRDLQVKENQLQVEMENCSQITNEFELFKQNFQIIKSKLNESQQQLINLQQIQFGETKQYFQENIEQSKEFEEISTINEIKEHFQFNLSLMESKLKSYEFEKFEQEQQFRKEFIKDSYNQFEQIQDITQDNEKLQEKIERLEDELQQEKLCTEKYKEEDNIVKSFLNENNLNELIGNENKSKQIREENLKILLIKERRRTIELKQLLNNLQDVVNKKSNELQTKCQIFNKIETEFAEMKNQFQEMNSKLQSYNEIKERDIQLTKEKNNLISSCQSMANQIKYQIFIIEQFKKGRQWEQIINKVNEMKGEVDFENGKIVKVDQPNEDVLQFQEISKIWEENQTLKKVVNKLYLQGMKGL